LNSFQGPALLAYNDAVFDEDDFASIQSIGMSKKKDCLFKTGKFGVGFNSVYHITDLPGFVSGSSLVIFDPHCEYVPSATYACPGVMLDFIENKSEIDKYPDQFLPFRVFDNDFSKPYNATFFRFPLRTPEQVIKSKLLPSKTEFNIDYALRLFDLFEKEARLILLFLKNLEVIELSIWEPSNNSPTVRFSTKLINTETFRLQRSRIINELKEKKSNDIKEIYPLQLQVTNNVQSKSETIGFLVCQRLVYTANSIQRVTANIKKRDASIKIVPWGGVAIPVSPSNLSAGQTFCFLPLPPKINIPAHINGYFELAQNRREIWYGADIQGETSAIRVDWNISLIRDVIAPAYADIVEHVARKGFNQQLFHMFPTEFPPEPWSLLVDAFYSEISQRPIFYTEPKSGGNWLKLKDVYFINPNTCNVPDQLAEILLEENLSIVKFPNNIIEMFGKNKINIQYISTQVIRNRLQQSGNHPALESFNNIGVILDFLLANTSDDNFDLIIKLPLIPLCNGSVGIFDSYKSENIYYIVVEEEKYLLRKIHHQCVEVSFGTKFLQKPKLTQKLNVKEFSMEDMIRILPTLLPKSEQTVNIMDSTFPSVDWIKLFWKYFFSKKMDINRISSYPLLPAVPFLTKDNDKEQSFLCKLDSGVVLTSDALKLPGNVRSILSKVGIFMIDHKIIDQKKISKYILSPDPEGLIVALKSSQKGRDIFTIFEKVTTSERRELRSFFSQGFRGTLSQQEEFKKLLMSLPIFDVYGVSHCVPISEKHLIPPDHVTSEILSSNFVISKNNTDGILFRQLGLQTISYYDFYQSYFISKVNEFPPEVRDDAVLTMLTKQIALDPRLKELIPHAEIIPTASGKLLAPKKIYDPRIKEFHQIFDSETSFPASNFRTDATLNILQSLGMKSELRLATLLESASSIATLSTEKLKMERSFALLAFLDANLQKIIDKIRSPFPSSQIYSLQIRKKLMRSQIFQLKLFEYHGYM